MTLLERLACGAAASGRVGLRTNPRGSGPAACGARMCRSVAWPGITIAHGHEHQAGAPDRPSGCVNRPRRTMLRGRIVARARLVRDRNVARATFFAGDRTSHPVVEKCMYLWKIRSWFSGDFRDRIFHSWISDAAPGKGRRWSR